MQTSGTTYDLRDVCFSDENNGTTVGYAGTILRTTDSGTTWSSQSSGTLEWLTGVSFIDANNGIVVGFNGIILQTTNGGITWNMLTSGTTRYLYDVAFVDMNHAIAVGQSGTIMKTTNGGITWSTLSSGTVNSLLSVSFTDTNNGTTVGSYGTILRTTNGGVTFVEEGRVFEVPTEYWLSQNYPNPFNPSTVISYQLPVIGFVTLKVYDILGREVTTLVDEEKPAGEYEVEFNASNLTSRQGSALTSGIYFYQLKAGDFIETRKMVLLK